MTLPPDANARFSAWMAEHGAIVHKVSRAYAMTERERDELGKELLFQVWQSAGRFAGQSGAATWIYRVCLNTAMAWRRQAGRREGRTDAGTDVAGLQSAAPGPAATVERQDLLEQVFAGLRALAETDRSLLLLQLDGLSYREIAEITGLTENHVGVALTRARQRLAAQMKGVIDELE